MVLIAIEVGCQSSSWNKSLPFSQDLGSHRGYRLARTITHLHSPISYDACDEGNPNCLNNLRSALCDNHIDFAFLTDHPNRMASTDFSDLHLSLPGDQSLLLNGNVIGNQFSCNDSQKVQVMAGYEDKLMPIGMTKHLDPDSEIRNSLYGQSTSDLVSRLQTETNAIVMVPHTESRTNEHLANLGMNGIEIYNLHSNINPTIRTNFLGMDYFSGLVDLSVYWVDPYARQQPDLAFISFLKVSPIYAKKWDYLISNGKQIVGIAGNDSHQNFFSGIANDGDRVDSHRRLTRWIVNYFLVNDMTLSEVKGSISSGKGWVVFEGFGTPVGIDFYAKNGDSTAEIGGSLSFQNGNSKIHAEIPTLHNESPQSGSKPLVIIHLKKVALDSSGNESEVANSVGTSLDYTVDGAGAYRIEIGIVPLHLINYIGFKKQLVTQEMPWLISNHIYIQ